MVRRLDGVIGRLHDARILSAGVSDFAILGRVSQDAGQYTFIGLASGCSRGHS